MINNQNLFSFKFKFNKYCLPWRLCQFLGEAVCNLMSYFSEIQLYGFEWVDHLYYTRLSHHMFCDVFGKTRYAADASHLFLVNARFYLENFWHFSSVPSFMYNVIFQFATLFIMYYVTSREKKMNLLALTKMEEEQPLQKSFVEYRKHMWYHII